MTSIFTLSKINGDNTKININDLYEKKREKDANELNLYKKILNKIHIKIREISRKYTDQQFCWFPIPETILGHTNYDSGNCIAYVMEQLISNGFQVQYYHPQLLFIVWAFYVPQYIREEFKKKTGYQVDETGNFIENTENQDIEEKNERNYIPIPPTRTPKRNSTMGGYKSTENWRL
jgi:hypothetical protein